MGVLESLRSAIVTAFDGASGLAACNGGLHFGRVPEGTALPYARYADVGSTFGPHDIAYTTSNVVYPMVMQFDVWATSRPAVTGYIEAIRDTFHRQSLALGNGKMVQAVMTAPPVFSFEAVRARDDKEAYRGRLSITFICSG